MLSTYSPLVDVVRLRAGTRIDSDGDPVIDWKTPTRLKIPGAKVQVRTLSEADAPSSAAFRDERVLRIPSHFDLSADDRVEISGAVYTVDGDPIRRTGLSYGKETTAFLVRTEGRRTT